MELNALLSTSVPTILHFRQEINGSLVRVFFFFFPPSGSRLTQLKLCLGRTVTTTPIITEVLPLGHYCNNNPSHSLLYCRSPLSRHTTSSLCTKKTKQKKPRNCEATLFTESASHKGAVNQSSLMLWVWIPRHFLTSEDADWRNTAF